MNLDNKTILLTGLLIGAILAMFWQYEQIATAIFSGLIGYLSKDHLDKYLETQQVDDSDAIEQ